MGLVVNAAPRPLYSWEKFGTHCIGGWVGPKGLDPRTIQTVASSFIV